MASELFMSIMTVKFSYKRRLSSFTNTPLKMTRIWLPEKMRDQIGRDH